MILGALVDCGVAIDHLRDVLAGLDFGGYEIIAEPTDQRGISGTRVRVVVNDDASSRDWSVIRTLLERARLPEPVRAASLATFAALADAEARVHGVVSEQVHFHEVGGVDAIIDIVGAAAGLYLLGVERVYSGAPALGRGFVMSRHGTIPVPAPATAQLLAASGAPSREADIDSELLTPTGAAILTTLAEFVRPVFRSSTVGYGFGQRELPWPNALRLWIGELDEVATDQDAQPSKIPDELLLETNIDDMNPEYYELLIERLFAAGALDVFLTPIIMKRGRPATIVSVIVAAHDRAAIEHILIENTTTFGIRAVPIDRTKVDRAWEQVTTRWGDVRVKLKIWRGRVIEAVPEYSDCLEVARRSEAPLRLIFGEATRAGEVFVGQRR
jgi:uncharacterized protein (TIGR00299 family) protein